MYASLLVNVVKGEGLALINHDTRSWHHDQIGGVDGKILIDDQFATDPLTACVKGVGPTKGRNVDTRSATVNGQRTVARFGALCRKRFTWHPHKCKYAKYYTEKTGVGDTKFQIFHIIGVW
jgi:hypothetical protein